MILRNTAGQAVLLGPLLALDGTPQTTGAAIAILKDGVDAGAPGGTLAHHAGGVWIYTSTAPETDCGIVGLVLSKADAVSVPLNVLTTRLPVQAAGVLPGAAAGSEGGLPVANASGRVAADVGAWAGEDVTPLSPGVPTVQLDATQPHYAPAVAGDAMTLAAGVRDSIRDGLATADLGGLIDADAGAFTTTALANIPVGEGGLDQAGVRAAMDAQGYTEARAARLGRIPDAAPGSEGGLPVLGTGGKMEVQFQATPEVALTSAYDAAKTAAPTANEIRAAIENMAIAGRALKEVLRRLDGFGNNPNETELDGQGRRIVTFQDASGAPAGRFRLNPDGSREEVA